MASHDRRGNHHLEQPPSGVFMLLLTMAAPLIIIALLHVAVQRERPVEIGQLNVRRLPSSLIGDSAEAVRAHVTKQ